MLTLYSRPFARLTALLLAAAALNCPQSIPAQTNPAAVRPQPVSNRYLFIVETSKAMLKRGDGTLDAVNALINNGMKGQMHAGDTLGIWTYNEKLHLGEFPLQVWTPANKSTVARNADYFLKRQKFENKPRVAEVIPTLQELIKDSDFITVILLNTGTEKIKGTPFDKEINTAWATWAPEQAKKSMPLLTLLRASKGVITHHAVVPLPWSWEMPPLPPDLVAAWDAAKKQLEAIATNKPPQAVGQPLIVKGKKTDATPTPAPSQPPVTPKPSEGGSTNKTPSQLSTLDSPSRHSEAKADLPSIASAKEDQPPVQLSTLNSQLSTNNAPTPSPPAPITSTAPDQKPPTAPPASPLQLAQANPQPSPSQPPAQPPVAPKRTEGGSAPSASQPSTINHQSSTTSVSQPSTLNSQLPDQPSSLNSPSRHSEAKADLSSIASAKEDQPSTTSISQLSTASVPTIWENEWFWVGIGIVTLTLAIIGYSIARRPRPASKISLITSSYDRTHKP